MLPFSLVKGCVSVNTLEAVCLKDFFITFLKLWYVFSVLCSEQNY